MAVIFALLSALFSALTAICSKIGLRNVDSHVATFLRTGVVLVFVWCFAFALGAHRQIPELTATNLGFLALSGVATGGSWLCYFKALSIGDLTRVAAIDKSSVVLTILFGAVFLGEGLWWQRILGIVAIMIGSFLMLDNGRSGVSSDAAATGKSRNMAGNGPSGRRFFSDSRCIFYAGASAVFAALTSIFAKVGLQDMDANLATALRTCVVFVFAGLMIPISGRKKELRFPPKKATIFLSLSAVATAAAWLFYFNALRDGDVIVVAGIDKLSTVFTVGFSFLFLREKITGWRIVGALVHTVGTLFLLLS